MLYVDHLLTGFGPLGRDIVHIKVGEEEQDFDIHKELTSLLLSLLQSCFRLGIRRGQDRCYEASQNRRHVFRNLLWMALQAETMEQRCQRRRLSQALCFCRHAEDSFFAKARHWKQSTRYQISTTTSPIPWWAMSGKTQSQQALSAGTSLAKLFENLHLSRWTHVKRNSLLKCKWKSTKP